MTLGTVLGTPGYFPIAKVWRDGSKKWDIWALVAIILEADMKIDVYFLLKMRSKHYSFFTNTAIILTLASI